MSEKEFPKLNPPSSEIGSVVPDRSAALQSLRERRSVHPEVAKMEMVLDEEFTRQIVYGLPPSDGLPDIRREFAVYPKHVTND